MTLLTVTVADLGGVESVGAASVSCTLAPAPSLDFSGCDFSGIDLSNADFSGADLTGANLSFANLTGAFLLGTTLEGSNLLGATLTGVASQRIVGSPSALPDGWALVEGMLLPSTKAPVTITAESLPPAVEGEAAPTIGYTTSPTTNYLNWTSEPVCGVFASTDSAFTTALTVLTTAGDYVTHCSGGASFVYEPTAYVNGTAPVAPPPSPATTIRGVVTTSDGRPIAGAVAEAWDADDVVEMAFVDPVTGEFTISGLPPGSYHVYASDIQQTSPYIGVWYPGVRLSDEATATPVVLDGINGATGINIVLPLGAEVGGHVVDTTGFGVADVDVVINGSTRTTTDASGAWRVIGLETGDYQIEFRPPVDSGLAPQFHSRSNNAAGASGIHLTEGETVVVDATLSPPIQIVGGVVTADGQPPFDMMVTATSDNGSFAEAMIDAGTGRYTLTGLLPDVYTLSFHPGSSGGRYGTTAVHVNATSWNADLTVDVADVLLSVASPSTTTISGSLTAGGTPMPGARVDLTDRFSTLVQTVFTDSNGGYQFTGLTPDSYCVRFDAGDSGYLSAYLGFFPYADSCAFFNYVDATQPIDVGLFDLQPGAEVFGTVLDASGDPVLEATVSMLDRFGRTAGSTTPTADGSFRIGGLPTDVYTLTVTTPTTSPYANDSSRVFLEAGSPWAANVVLQIGGSIHGSARRADGTPVAGALAHLVGRTSADVHTAEDGTFSFTKIKPSHLYRLGLSPSGTAFDFTYWWHDNASQFTADIIDVGPGSEVNGLDFVVADDATLSGTVNIPVGTLLPDFVEVVAPGSQSGLTIPVQPDGSFSQAGVAPGDYLVLARAPYGSSFADTWFPSTSIQAEATVVHLASGATTNITIDMQQGGDVAGQVTDALGQPIAGAAINVVPQTPGTFCSFVCDATTDEGGNYLLAALPPGDYKIRVTPPDGSGLAVAWFGDSATATTAETVTVIAAGALADVVLQQAALLTGTVLDPNGTPAPFATVTVVDPTEQTLSTTTTDFDGSFVLSGVPAGDWFIKASPSDSTALTGWYPSGDRSTAMPVSFAAGSTVTVTVPLLPAATVHGVVTDSSGAPVSFAEVQFFDPSNVEGSFGSTFTDEFGAYTLEGLAPGLGALYVDTVNGDHAPNGWFPGVIDIEDRQLVDTSSSLITQADIVLPTAVVIEGTVTDLDGPVEGACVRPGRDWIAIDRFTLVGFCFREGTFTDAAGHYRLTNVAPGNSMICVFGDASIQGRECIGDQPSWINSPGLSTVEGGTYTGVDFQFGVPGSTAVTSLDITGTALKGDRVVIEDVNNATGESAVMADGITGPLGTVRIDALTPGVYRARSTTSGATGTLTVTSRTVATITLRPLPATTVPGRPTALSGQAGEGSVRLEWLAPSNDGGTTITDYRVEYSIAEVGTWTTFTDGTSPTTGADITGLSNGVGYSFRVTAINAVGEGDPSDATPVISPRTTPSAPGEPSGVAGNGTVEIYWSAPAADGGAPITDYIVEFSSDAGVTWTTASDDTSDEPSATISGLTNGVAYLFRTAAVNAAGTGPRSVPTPTAIKPRTVPDTPVAPVGVASSAQVVLTWTAPTFDGGAAVTDYVIESSSDFGGTWTTESRPVSPTTTATIAGLTNGVSYVFRVSAINEAGTSAASPQSVSLTPRGTPSQPGVPTAQPGNTRIDLIWTSPVTNGGAPITDYVVQFSSNAGSTWTTFNDGASPATNASVTGLTNGTTYVFRVAAVNELGTSLFSAASVAVAPRTTPGTPGTPSGTAGDARVTLTWTAPVSNGGAPVVDYLVERSIGRNGPWTRVDDGVSPSTSTAITGLVNGTSYNFRVAAVNAAGAGAFSAISAAVRPIGPPSAPAAPNGTASDQQVALTWTAPANGGSAITDYRIEYSTDGTVWRLFVDSVSTTRSATVRGLTNGTTYRFRITAVNAAGASTPGASSGGITPFALPTAPGRPSGTPGVRQVTLSWTAPTNTGGGVVSDYRIQYSSNGGRSWSTFVHSANSSTTQTVTGLVTGTSYVFRVAAITQFGTGPFSANSATAVPR